MAGETLTSPSITFGDINFSGGLNTTAGPLSLQNTESPDLQNVDFNKFGSILTRNGYTELNSTVASLSTGSITAFADGGDNDTEVTSASHLLSNGAIVEISGTTNYDGIYTINTVTANTFVIETAFVSDDATGTWNETAASDGLHWFEFVSSGSTVRKLVNMTGGGFYKMDDLDGTWDDATNAQTITAGNPYDFASFNNELYMCNGADTPLSWDGAGTSSLTTMTLPTGLTDSKYVELYENYLFLANVIVSAASKTTRIYFSNIDDATTWTDTDFIEVSKDDGQEITRIQVLGDSLIIFKERSIYSLKFTGDADIPFVLRKTNSEVGCIAPFSVQEVKNGVVFLSYDGFYFFDGNNSFKISEKIGATLESYNIQAFGGARSYVQLQKNRYMCALPSSGQTDNDRVLVWDFFLNAWSLYTGMTITAATTVYVAGIEERPYFADDAGYTYRADTGTHDSPEKVDTAIDAYYYTNWRPYQDLIHRKAVPHVTIYFQTSESVLTFSYTYDFQTGDQYSQVFSLSGGGDMYGSAEYDSATYVQEGGKEVRRDLSGQGRVVRYKFSNSTLDENFQIDGLGQKVYADTEK